MKAEVQGFYDRPVVKIHSLHKRDKDKPIVPMITVFKVKTAGGKLDKVKTRICPNGAGIPQDEDDDKYAAAPSLASVRMFAQQIPV